MLGSRDGCWSMRKRKRRGYTVGQGNVQGNCTVSEFRIAPP